jgi:hypothetical protein
MWVPQFDGRTAITLSQTITLSPADAGGNTWGANGNHAQIAWVGPAGGDMIVYKGVKGGNRCLFLEKFNLYGGGGSSPWRPCGTCLTLDSTGGDNFSLYKFTLRDIFTANGTYGIKLIGAVFEGRLDNCHGESHQEDGLYMKHTDLGTDHQGIVSNIFDVGPNMSRNLGAGITSVCSHVVIGGSFILNGQGGVVAPEGLRVGAFSNGENSGKALYVIPNAGYGSLIIGNEGSTDGTTVCRKWVGVSATYPDGWQAMGKPQLYVLEGDANVHEVENHMSTYGAASRMPSGTVRVRK